MYPRCDIGGSQAGGRGAGHQMSAISRGVIITRAGGWGSVSNIVPEKPSFIRSEAKQDRGF